MHQHTTQVAQKTLQAAAKKSKAAPGAPTKKKRKRSAHEGESDSDDNEGIEITPPEEEATPPPVGSVVEVTITADMTAEESQVGIHVCTITEYEDDGAMMSRNQDGEVMNIFLEDYEWRQVWKCRECDDFGGRKRSCEHCGVLRPAGVIAACDAEDIGE